MKIAIALLIFLFLSLIAMDFYGIFRYDLSFLRHSIYFLLYFAMLLLIKRKIAWFALLILSAYGIYSMYFIDMHAAEPSFVHITSSLVYVLKEKNASSVLLAIADTIPFYFYCFTALLLLIRPCRNYYGLK